MTLETKPYDPALFLRDDTIIQGYLQDAYDSDEPGRFLLALKTVAQVKGIAQISQSSGLGRQSLYKTLSEDAHPRWETIQKILKALDVKVQFAA